VFGGAGWVLFGIENPAKVEIFNDLNSALINLYRCIKYHREEFEKELTSFEEWIPNSREIFMDYLHQLDNRGFTDIQRAARYFYLIRISYGSGKKTFGGDKKSICNSIKILPDIQKRLKDVIIENCDFEKIMKRYDRKNSLFYLDPPYYNAEKYYQGFSKDDHIRLFDALTKLKGKFILSYNDDEFIRRLYKDFNIIEVERSNNLAKGVYKELIIKNY